MKSPGRLLDSFGARTRLEKAAGSPRIASLAALEKRGVCAVSRLPFCLRILMENLVRHEDGEIVTSGHVEALARWPARNAGAGEIPFLPARILLQDFTGIPVLVDLATMRDAAAARGTDPAAVNPAIPVDMVVDHSVILDSTGIPGSLDTNVSREYERNRERYEFLRWGQKNLRNFRVVPPSTGIVHQVNLECLAEVVARRDTVGGQEAFPDTVLGADSHTTMINALSVLGWGVGGIEAEAAMLGHPVTIPFPELLGVRLTGTLPEGVTASDLALTLAELLRAKGVVGKFVEFFGNGVDALTLADRATLSNMAPEYGATAGFFPADATTLEYLKLTGRKKELVELVEIYLKEQGLFRTPGTPAPEYPDTLELDLGKIERSLAGPRRPHDRIALPRAKEDFGRLLAAEASAGGFEIAQGERERRIPITVGGREADIGHGSVVIAAITSCTTTSNPHMLICAGLLARKAAELGLKPHPAVKTSFTPGSRAVRDYLETAGLLEPLATLGFAIAGYGCATCIGNSGPLDEAVAAAIREGGLTAAAVLSGNRNFEGRINPLVRANYLVSPPLVVAFAIAGRVDIDLSREPVGRGKDGKEVFLRDIWPRSREVEQTVARAVTPAVFVRRQAELFGGDANWNSLPAREGSRFAWDQGSAYLRPAPFFEPASERKLSGARVLAHLGDSVSTDLISPAGAIPSDSPAGRYLVQCGVAAADFNSYGSRRGNHEVMVRGAFASPRLKNRLVPGTEGGFTHDFTSGEKSTIFDASLHYAKAGVPVIVLAGREYGSGSSRDWAAKGPALLGVRAVIAAGFERLHRTNLLEMGILPLEFKPGETAESFQLTGREAFDIAVPDKLPPRSEVSVTFRREDGSSGSFRLKARLDTSADVEYFRRGGILPLVLDQICKG